MPGWLYVVLIAVSGVVLSAGVPLVIVWVWRRLRPAGTRGPLPAAVRRAAYEQVEQVLGQLGDVTYTGGAGGAPRDRTAHVQLVRNEQVIRVKLTPTPVVILGTSVRRSEREVSPGSAGDPFRAPGRSKPLRRLHFASLRAKTRRDRWGAALGLNAELRTGEGEFDDSYYLDTEAKEMQELFAEPRVRARSQALFDFEIDRIIFGAPTLEHLSSPIEVRWTRPPRDGMSRESIEKSADALLELVQELPLFNREPMPRRRPRGVGAGLLFWLGALIGMGLSLASEEWWPPFETPFRSATVFATVVGLGLAWPALFVWLRRRPTGFRYFVWTAFPLIVGLPTLTHGGLTTVNGAWDSSDELRATRVLKRWRRDSSDSATSYYVEVEPWPPFVEPIKLDVSKHDHSLARPGCKVHVNHGKGWLGKPWFRRLEAIPGECP